MKKLLLTSVAAAALTLTQVQAAETTDSMFAAIAVTSTQLQAAENKKTKESIKVEKAFKNSYDTQTIAKAFSDAAEQNSWSVKKDGNGNLVLAKNFCQKSKYYNHAAFRGTRKIINETVQLAVNINATGFTMNLMVNDKDSRIAQDAQDAMGELESLVYTNLAASAL